MKTFIPLFAILVMAFVTMPVIASEALGPPGITVAPIDFASVLFPVAVQVQKEVTPIGFDLIVVSTYASHDVAPGFPRPVTVSAFVAVYPRVEPMLAGLMYGSRLNGWMDNAAEAYLIPIVSDTRPDLGAVA